MESLKEIEKRLTGKNCDAHLNDVAQIYEFCESGDLGLLAESLKTIARVLAHQRRRKAEDLDSKVAAWLKQHTEFYHTTLAKLATSSNPRAQVCAVRLSMAAVQAEAEEVRLAGPSLTRAAVVLPPTDARVGGLLDALLMHESWDNHVFKCLANEYIKVYVDVRHYVVNHLRKCAAEVVKEGWSSTAPPRKKLKMNRNETFVDNMKAKGRTPEELFTRVYSLLVQAPTPGDLAEAGGGEGEEAEGSTAQTLAFSGRPISFFVKGYRKVFQDAWLQLLCLHVPFDHCAAVMQHLPGEVMPHLSQPLLLSDFYLRAFHGGSLEISVLSLSGLLLLLTRHGLGDPDAVSSSQEFYAQMYGLIGPETFRLKKRARFQRLVVAALNSGLLPARFAAAFAKRCMQTAVSCADPGTVMWLMSVAYSLIQKHHSHCKHLLHRPGGAAEAALDCEPFEAKADLATAVEQVQKSSLWEVQLLRRHHVPAVTALAKLFLRPFFKPGAKKMDPELMLDQSFENLYRQALRSSTRQATRQKARGEKCAVAFKFEDDMLASSVFGWAAALSTDQRKVGAGV